MQEQTIPKRKLGNTGLDVSVLGLGGFHQVETSYADVQSLLGHYMAAGGNYVEVARGYGGGVAEEKLGRALEHCRDSVVLVTKTAQRTAEGAWRELNESLEALRTDHVDLLLYHNLSDPQHIETIAGPGGAQESFQRAREQGMLHFVGASAHWPLLFLQAMECLQLDAVMYWVNYLVACNYPEIYDTVAHAARSHGLGIIGMKPLGDGYLYRSVKPAFDYALAQEVDVLACGFNSLEMLQADIEAVCRWKPQSAEELEAILRDAPELGDYVCRQCGKCRLEQLDLPRVFELEGKFDRQMFDGRPIDAPHYALRERLRYWFGNQERAIELYRCMAPEVEQLLASDGELPTCPYGIDLRYKLRLAHAKLTGNGRFPAGAYTI